MKLNRLLLASLLLSNMALATTTAIIDSGVDLKHPQLLNRAWQNPNEILNGADDDYNGLVDDINGWNFSDNNAQLINPKYMRLVHDTEIMDLMKTLEGKTSLNDLSKNELEMVRALVKRRPDIFDQMSAFGNFMHGTHVAGIAARDNNSDIMAIKLIPTDQNDSVKKVAAQFAPMRSQKGIREKLISKAVVQLAEMQAQGMQPIGQYLKRNKVEVANCSYGTGYPQAEAIAKQLLSKLFLFSPPKKDIDKVARNFINAMNENQKKYYIDAAPNTLFVFAAGNDGLSNDDFPSAPNNIIADNIISVAATDGVSSLATFSNYGVRGVDVAAPGVNILSSIPDGGEFRVSGTSQAAPYVSNVAARIIEENSALTPAQMKKILIGTVTKVPFLKGKVKSEGIVNVDRAVRAAEYSKKMSVEVAIAKANAEISRLTLID